MTISCFVSVCVTLLGASGLGGVSPPATHGAHPPMPGQEYFIQVRIQSSAVEDVIQVPVELANPTVAAELKQAVPLTPPLPAIRLRSYIPQAVLDQTVVPADAAGGKPAIHLKIEGPTQSFARWLIADDPARNRLTSMIGTWRYMAVADRAGRDTLLTEFREEFTRKPMLRVARLDGTDAVTVPAREGVEQDLGGLKCRIKVLAFFTHYAMKEGTGKPVNQSDRRVNPAAHVELRCGDHTEKRWIFSKFPDFGHRDAAEAPLSVTLDCPAEALRPTPDVVLVTIGGENSEAWVRHEGKIATKELSPDAAIALPASKYRFRIAKLLPSGRLVERYVKAPGRGGVPALRIETDGADGKPIVSWLKLNQPHVISTSQGSLTVLFGLSGTQGAEGHH